jgi:hypothetical protein
MYQGKDEDSKYKSGLSALLRNVRYLANSKRVIFCDRYYTTVGLFIQLLALGLYAFGAIKTNICGYPKHIKMHKKDKFERGFSRCGLSRLNGNGNAWKDKKSVHLISTAYMNSSTTCWA